MSLLDARQTPPGAAHRGGARQAASVGKLRYLQVIDIIDGIVAERGLGPGDLLPTQKELASLAGVSLITVRRALDELERSGRVSGHQGVGTFVARPRIVSEPTRSGGLLATLAEQGSPREVTTQVLEVRTARPRPTVAHTLGLAPGKPVWQIVRLRLIDGQPQVIEQALIPQALAPDLGRRRAVRLFRAGLSRRRVRLLHLGPDGAPPPPAGRPARLGRRDGQGALTRA